MKKTCFFFALMSFLSLIPFNNCRYLAFDSVVTLEKDL